MAKGYEDGLTCPSCGDLAPWDGRFCVGCGEVLVLDLGLTADRSVCSTVGVTPPSLPAALLALVRADRAAGQPSRERNTG